MAQMNTGTLLAAASQHKTEGRYWLERLSGEFDIPFFPDDLSKPRGKKGDVHQFTLLSVSSDFPSYLSDLVWKISKQSDHTLNVLLTAACTMLLYFYSGKTDILVGTPVVRQEQRHDFINCVLVLRIKIAETLTVKEVLAQVKLAITGADHHQNYPFELLRRKLAPAHTTDDFKLFDVAVLLDNTRERAYLESDGSKPGLIFIFHRWENHIQLTLEYDSTRYLQETADRVVRHLLALLQDALTHPDKRIEELDILSHDERVQLLETFNHTGTDVPVGVSLSRIFEDQVEKAPDSLALILAFGESERKVVTYRELNNAARLLADQLKSRGVGPDTIVALLAERSVEMIIGMMGILKAGGAYLPLSKEFPAERTGYMLNDSQVRFLVVQSSLCPSWLSTGIIGHYNWRVTGDLNGALSIVNCQLAMTGKDDFINTAPFDLETQAGHLAYVIYTSGTTGKPKGVLITQANVTRLVRETGYIKITADDRLLQLSNYAFDGSVFDIFGALLNGAVLVMIRDRDVLDLGRLVEVIHQETITLFLITTALFNALVDVGLDGFDSVRQLLFGGERISVEHTRRAIETLGAGRLIHVYGPTETTVFVTYQPVDTVPVNRSTVPIGRPLDDMGIYILDSRMKLVPVGVAGELFIGGQGTARGYLNRPELTAEKFITLDLEGLGKERVGVSENGNEIDRKRIVIYKSGDLGRWLPDGCIEYIGRMDRQVKLRGFRVELGEIENRLKQLPFVKEAVVMSHDRILNNEGVRVECSDYLCAYVVAHPRDEDISTRVKKELEVHLPKFMIPAYVIDLEKLPLTPNGKVDYRALRVPHTGKSSIEKDGTGKNVKDYIAPRDKNEVQLVELWATILGVVPEAIGIDDDFFNLGGQSVKATVLAFQVEKLFNVKLPLLEIFKTSTIRQLAAYITGAKGEMVLPRDESLVLLRKAAVNKGSSNIFFIHDGTGRVDGYLEFCTGIDSRWNCWGLQWLPGMVYHPGPQNVTVPGLAGEYIQSIKNIQAGGPYRLAGWSSGGTIAFEMARQLEEKGDRVDFLALIDSPAPREYDLNEAFRFNLEFEQEWVLRFIPGHEVQVCDEIKKQTSIEQTWEVILRYLETSKVESRDLIQVIPGELAAALFQQGQMTIQQTVDIINSIRSLYRAREYYWPCKQLSTPVYFFLAEHPQGMEQPYDNTMIKQWKKWTRGELTCYLFYGDHYHMLKDVFASSNAQIFNQVLEALFS